MTAAAAPPGEPDDIDALVKELQELLRVESRPVTARWLCYERACPASAAQAALTRCIKEGGPAVKATYLLVGASHAGEQVLRLVASDHLADAKAELQEGATCSVYAVAPGQPPADAIGLHVHDLEQANQLVKEVVSGAPSDQARAYSANASSCIRCENNARVVRLAKAAPAPQDQPPSADAAPTSLPDKAAKADAAPGASGPVAKNDGEAEEAPQASGKKKKQTAAAGGLGKAFAKAKSSACTMKAADTTADEVRLGSATTATVPAANKGKSEGADQDDMETDSPPLPVRKAGVKGSSAKAAAPRVSSATKRSAKVAVLDDDSDDDFEAQEVQPERSPSGDEPEIAQNTVGVDVPSKRQPSQQLVKTATGKQACKGRSENTAPASPGPASEAAAPAKRDVTLHPVYGAPPDPDAEVTMVNGKPMWQYMNDKGEEVTVAAVKAQPERTGYAPTREDKATTKPRKATSAALDSPAAAKTAPEEGKKKKASAKAKVTGFGDLRNMFSKK